MDGKSLSKYIRDKKKKEGQANLRPDMDYAGQEAVDPNEAWDDKMAHEVNETLGDPDHEPASEEEMGENDSSQDKMHLKKAMARINSYMDKLLA
jgi:hypothetical protein